MPLSLKRFRNFKLNVLLQGSLKSISLNPNLTENYLRKIVHMRETKKVIKIPVTETLRWISTFVSIGVKFLLAIYFFSQYTKKKRRAPLVWCGGFFLFGLSQVPILAMRYFRDPTTNIFFALLAAFLAALSLGLLYYGASLLYFTQGSFMREKFSVILWAAMLAAIIVFVYMVPREAILSSVFFMVAAGFIFPVLLAVALIFFVVWYKLDPTNPKRVNVLLVGAAWLAYSVVNGIGSFYFGTPFEWMFYILSIVSFLFLLFGMSIGKVTGH